MSLDGYIAGKDDDLSWLKPFESSNEDHGFLSFYQSCDALLMGRKTYDVVCLFKEWPYKDKPVYVASHREFSPSSHAKRLVGDFKSLASSADLAKFTKIYVDGGNLIRQALDSNELSTMTVSMIPVILGEGTRGLDPANSDHKLELIESKSFASGIVQLRYRCL